MSEKGFWHRFNQSLENQRRLISGTDYVDWLYEFTKKYPKFSDTTWLYEKDPTMSETDYSQVDLLQDFFGAVYRYYLDNLLEGNKEGYATWYNIKYKDAYFAIGIVVGQGASNFVTRYQSYEEMLPESFVDFESILKKETDPELYKKKKAIREMQVQIEKVRDLGVSKETVESIIHQVFQQKN